MANEYPPFPSNTSYYYKMFEEQVREAEGDPNLKVFDFRSEGEWTEEDERRRAEFNAYAAKLAEEDRG